MKKVAGRFVDLKPDGRFHKTAYVVVALLVIRPGHKALMPRSYKQQGSSNRTRQGLGAYFVSGRCRHYC